MKQISRIIFALLLISCGTQKETVTEEPIEPRPSWVSSKPIDPTAYSGIGMAYKSAGADYIAIAKNNALNDLASEISVNISSSSLFYQIEQDDNLREEFQANTQLKSKENLVGYELVGSYENSNEYWIYYRLDKAGYTALKRQREESAIALAKQLYQNAIEFKAKQQYAESIKFNVKAIAALKDFMAEPLQTNIDGEDVFLHVELFSKLQQSVSEIELSALHKLIQTKRGQSISAEQLTFSCTSTNGNALAGIPVFLYYSGARIPNNQVYSNVNGLVSYTIPKVTSKNNKEYFQANLNMVSLVSEATDDPFIRKLLAKVSGPEERIEINIEKPKVYIQTSEYNLGRTMPTSPLASAFKSSFIEEGFSITESEKDADYRLNISAKTRVAEKNDRYATANLDAIFGLRGKDAQLIYEKQVQSFQGLQLTPEKAGEDAYKKLAKEIEKRYFREMRRKVFD